MVLPYLCVVNFSFPLLTKGNSIVSFSPPPPPRHRLASSERFSLIKCVHKVTESNIKESSSSNRIPNEYPECLGEIGTLKSTNHMETKDDVSPVLVLRRKLPFAQKYRLKKELDQMEKIGLIGKVEKSTDWVTSWSSSSPIVYKNFFPVQIYDFKFEYSPVKTMTVADLSAEHYSTAPRRSTQTKWRIMFTQSLASVVLRLIFNASSFLQYNYNLTCLRFIYRASQKS